MPRDHWGLLGTTRDYEGLLGITRDHQEIEHGQLEITDSSFITIDEVCLRSAANLRKQVVLVVLVVLVVH